MEGWTPKESVAGTKNASQAERNRRICLLRRNGFTFSEIAGMENISRARVSQIVHEFNAELPEDETRAEIATLLEFAERKAIELINEPGYVCGPNGRVVEDPDGVPLPNKTIVDNALKTLILVADRKSRLYGADKQVVKKMDTPTAQEAMWAALAVERQRMEARALAAAERDEFESMRRELEALRRQAAVIPGQVVRELEPGS